MMRVYFLLGVLLVLSMSLACKEREYAGPLIVHVLRAPSASFAKDLRRADLQFGLSRAHVHSGEWIMIATNEGNSYPMLVSRLADSPWDLLILNSPSDLPESGVVRDRIGRTAACLRGSTSLHSGLGFG